LESVCRGNSTEGSNPSLSANLFSLARDFGTKRFGSEGYAMEELVAELGAAFLCADLDLTLEPREDHAAYIANWLEILKSDGGAIFAAASHAQRAADFINGLQPASAV
jgi:antirestriction protein ArdC